MTKKDVLDIIAQAGAMFAAPTARTLAEGVGTDDSGNANRTAVVNVIIPIFRGPVSFMLENEVEFENESGG